MVVTQACESVLRDAAPLGVQGGLSAVRKAIPEAMVAHALRHQRPLVKEIFTTTSAAARTAEERGHAVGKSLSLELGQDFFRPDNRAAALAEIEKEKPLMVILAFPCSPWSALMNLNPGPWVERAREKHLSHVRFAVQVARLQASQGRFYFGESPDFSCLVGETSA